MRFRELIAALDWMLAAAAILLLLLGLAMLFSAGYTTPNLLLGRFGHQALAAIMGGALFVVMIRIPYHFFQRYAVVLYGVGVGSLVIVALSARIIRGAASRLSLVGFQLQPSEFMKIILVVMIAAALSRAPRLRWSTILASALITAVPVILVILEPDMGTASLMLSVWGVVIIFAGISWMALGALGFSGVALALTAWRWFLFDYQKKRILTFLNPRWDPLGSGYNVVQSIIAFGSGRLFGRGLGHGPQSQLKFLPEQQTDFIFASIGEELGLIGAVLVMGLYALLLWRIIRIAQRTRDPFGQLICVGAFAILLMSFVVSVGMNMGILPVTGIPLPLVSYGGSHILATCALLGLVESVHLHSKWVSAPPAELSYLT